MTKVCVKRYNLPLVLIIVKYEMLLAATTTVLLPAEIAREKVRLLDTKLLLMMVTLWHTVPPILSPAATVTVLDTAEKSVPPGDKERGISHVNLYP